MRHSGHVADSRDGQSRDRCSRCDHQVGEAKSRGITVTYETKSGQKSIDLDVSRKAEITVNGEAANVDALRPGQKAKITYEKELQVVTKIDATGTGVVMDRAVWRLRLTVSEFGDCTLKAEQTTTPITSATNFDGESMKLSFLPNTEVLKAADGSVRTIHSFERPDELSRVFSGANRIELDNALGAVTFLPQKGNHSGRQLLEPSSVADNDLLGPPFQS